MRRIAVITTSYPSDDDDVAGHFVRAEVRQMLDAGNGVTVFAPNAPRTRGHFDERVVGIPHAAAFGSPGALIRMRWRPDRWLGATRFAVVARHRLFKGEPFDQVVSHFLLPSYWPISQGHPASSRVVVHGSDLRLLERVPKQLQAHVLACLSSQQPTIQCASYDLAQRFDRLAQGRLQRLIEVRSPPLQLPAMPSKAELRQQLGVDSRLLIVIASRLIASKRVDVAVGAALKVPGVQIVVCGQGPEYKRLVRRFPAVKFTGQLPRQQALMWIGAADVLLCASRDEGAPTVIREARELGVPVVTTAAGDLLVWAQSDPHLYVVP